MSVNALYSFLILLVSFRFTLPVLAVSPSSYVNNFIGTSNGGHVFAGASLPFGSVKAVADSDSGDNQAGYVSDGSPIRGISVLHDDGTGGSPSLGQFKVLPMYCPSLGACNTTESSRSAAQVQGSAVGSPGYFSISLAGGIQTEVTVTEHAALHRFTFSAYVNDSVSSAVLLFDLTNDLQYSFQGQGVLDITYTQSPGSLRLRAAGKYRPSFGIGSYKVYSCMDIPNVSAMGYYIGGVFHPLSGSQTVAVSSGQEAGILASYTPSSLQSSGNVAFARVGVSWSSADRACSYAQAEIPGINPSSFAATKAAATKKWDQTLGTISIDTSGVSNDFAVLFYSSLYRSYLSPMNITGDNPLWKSTEPYYDSFYCIWDSFRVVHPLYAITQRSTQAEIVRALIEIYRHEGYLPDCRMSLDQGYTQGGSNADNLLSDSYVKGITAGINWEDGLAAMIKDATVTPPDWLVEGRGGIERRKILHYVPVDDDTPGWQAPARSASRTLEYAFNDFGIALVANGLGHAGVAAHYQKASGDWQYLWNPNTTNSGFSGFIQPRYINGSWDNVDPRQCSPVLNPFSCFLGPGGGEFYEASSWAYSYFVPQDMATVVKRMGGKTTFIQRLDAFFANGFHDSGDEPGFLPPFLYNYAGRPDKTVDRVLGLLRNNYNASVAGLPGNDDSGAMGGFVVFATFGFYPQAGTGIYLLSTPLFRTITYPTNNPKKTATITTVNFDGAITNKYIVSAKLNGAPFTRSWFAHRELFANGGVLQLTLGSTPSSWGTADADVPPSISTSPLSRFS